MFGVELWRAGVIFSQPLRNMANSIVATVYAHTPTQAQERELYAMEAGRQQRAGAEKEATPPGGVGHEAAAKRGPEVRIIGHALKLTFALRERPIQS